MKSLRYLLISALTLFATNQAFACWDEWYGPEGYYMYRVYPLMQEPTLDIDGCYPGAGRNCASWQELTSSTIPLEDIYKVVYSMTLKDFEKIYDNRNIAYENKFAEWITKKDTALLDFLHLAKTNEYLRLKHNSRWHYPTMKTGARMTLEEVANKALSATDARLRDRYLLQAVRALFSLTRYEECVTLWDNEVSKLPADNLMRRLIQPYIAGAEFRLNHTDRAMEYFAHIGDVESLYYCAEKLGHPTSKVGALEMVCRYAPNSPYIAQSLQGYVREIEPEGTTFDSYGSGYFEEQERARRDRIKWLRPFCLNMAKNSKVENPAMWYYTAAFLSDLIGETNKASQYLSLAEKSKSTPYIAESIKVMRIYLDAKLSKYDSAYEAKLFEQLKWLDSKVANNITDEVRIKTTQGYHINSGQSYYYWNDMLRRIVLAEVCPRMMKAGKTTRALQLANMADNRLFALVDRHDFYKVLEKKGHYDYERVEGSTMKEFRYAENKGNAHDYSNHFFEMIDSLGVNTVEKYVQNVNAPKTEFDRFLNARGYTESDYLNDIVGTQCLREMRYGEAVKYLSRVSDAYNKGHLNVTMRYNPFSIKRELLNDKCDTRYEFAKEMHELEQDIKSEKDPNVKAQKTLKFAVGLRNSFDRCWPLTHYYKGVMHWGCAIGYKREWEIDKYTKSAMNRSKEMMALACTMATDEEVAANINYELCNFKSIAEKYPNTEKGRLVRGKCDKLYDYHVERKYTTYDSCRTY